MGDVKKLEELDLLEKRLKGKYPTDEELLTFLVSIKHFMVKSGVDCEVKPEMPAPQMTDCLIAQNNTLRSELECRNTALHLQKTIALQLSYQLQCALAENRDLRIQLQSTSNSGSPLTAQQFRYSPTMPMASSTSSTTLDYQEPISNETPQKRKRV